MKSILLTLFVSLSFIGSAQLFINEASNKNFSTLADEDGEYNDWIEIYNAGASPVDLFNYSLSDDIDVPAKWVFPHTIINPGEYKIVFCSRKDRYESDPFVTVINTGTFNAASGWNTHTFTTPFNWDGTSNVVFNVCSYSSAGYTVNSVFNQSATSFLSTLSAYQDGGPGACSFPNGAGVSQRPNVRLNGLTIGTGTITNSGTDYPAPYGNWYWGARTQMLFRASELTAAGLSAGNITSLAFDVVTPDPATYDYIEISANSTLQNDLASSFLPLGGLNNHTNFSLAPEGEFIYLFNPSGVLLSNLFVNCSNYDNSVGLFPDATGVGGNFFSPPTPGASNNSSTPYATYCMPPVFSVASGFYSSPLSITITNPNTGASEVRYTTDGSDPTPSSTLYTGVPIPVFFATVLKARVFKAGELPSSIATSSYFFSEDHITPIISVVTANDNLYGPTGMFDHPGDDWLKPAHIEYFDSTNAHNLVFSQPAGIIMDGGAGGSRYQPQRSFRIELANGTLGGGSVNYNIHPDRPTRNKYSNLYLRNGSNQFLNFPYKDACQVRMMCKTTHNYYSSWRPVSVYINGQYFGLYELREKFDTEMFKELDGADPDSTEILSLSYFYGGMLRAVEGSVDNFWDSYNAFDALSPTDTSYWTQADNYFDLVYYTDYIIAETWMGNVDWPYNNIKIYRSDATDYRWRFCVQDLELSLNPGGWTDCYADNINYIMGQSPSNPYINVWLQSIQNTRYKNYFINRYADVMNTEYDTSRLLPIASGFFDATVVEMVNEYQRWGTTDIAGQMTNFYNNNLIFQAELACRTTQVREDIETHFGLTKQIDVNLDVYPANAGQIQISTITPTTYPWSGVYFDGVPLKIQAKDLPGYNFSHWVSNGIITDTLNPVFEANIPYDDLLFKAIYVVDTISSVNEESVYQNAFKIYPNLTDNLITISNNNEMLAGNYSYSILTSSGALVSTGELNAGSRTTTVRVSDLEAGIYIVQIANKTGILSNQRFVKY